MSKPYLTIESRTFRDISDDPVFVVYEISTYGRGSVLAGQTRRSCMDTFDTLAEAIAKYPNANPNGCGYIEPPRVNHLPDDDMEDYEQRCLRSEQIGG